jgi:carboxymethylenebutenolidase
MERVSIPVEDGVLPAVVVHGARVPGPVVVMVPAAFGVADDVLSQLDEMAEHASMVVALDLFWRDGRGIIPYVDMPNVMARIRDLDRERAVADVLAVCRWARVQDGSSGQVLGLGVCLGGPFVFLAAQRGFLDAVVTWHGSRLDTFLADADAMRCPMALHFGECDRVVPLDTVDRVKAAFAGRDDVEVTVHLGADHGFSHPLGPTYDEAAARAGMESVRGLLAGLGA